MVTVEDPQDMAPLKFLQEWSKNNPKLSAIIISGIACFSAVAVILSFGIDLESNIKNVYYIVGIGLSVIVVSEIVNNKIMFSAITWFCFVLMVLWTIAFIMYKGMVLDSAQHQRLACVVRFWDECRLIADNVAKESAPKLENKITLAASFVPKAEIGKSLKVFVQFAGNISRDSVRTMMQDLERKGWAVQGTQGGGERTIRATGQWEVRYSGDNAAAADSLARAVSAYGISGRPVKPVSNPAIPGDQLEVWISN